MPRTEAPARRPVLSVCLGGFPGTDRALRELAGTTGLIRHLTLADASPGSLGTRFLSGLLADIAPRLLVVGGWADEYGPFIDDAVARGVRVAAYWTSSGGQSEIGREMDRLERLMSDPRLHARWFSHAPLAAALAGSAAGVASLPSILPDGWSPRATRSRRRPGAPIAVGVFSSPHEYHRKNMLNSLLAVAQLGGGAQLHVNGASRPGYRQWLDRLGIDCVDHGWMDDATYARVVASLDVALQASFAESFNYVAAEHLLCGVPVVGSPMVPVLHLLPPDLRRAFTVDTPDNPMALAARVRALAGRSGKDMAAAAAAALRRRRPGQVNEATRVIRGGLARPRAGATRR